VACCHNTYCAPPENYTIIDYIQSNNIESQAHLGYTVRKLKTFQAAQYKTYFLNKKPKQEKYL